MFGSLSVIGAEIEATPAGVDLNSDLVLRTVADKITDNCEGVSSSSTVYMTRVAVTGWAARACTLKVATWRIMCPVRMFK